MSHVAIFMMMPQNLIIYRKRDLNTKQLNWIEQKEDKTEEERLKYNGGTLNMPHYISLYESIKERWYELVNKSMTD